MTPWHIDVAARVGALALDVRFDVGFDVGADPAAHPAGGAVPAVGTVVVVGPNGAGKSSLLAVLLGVRPAQRARVVVGDRVLQDTARGVFVPVEERRLGYVPQDHALFPRRTVRAQLHFAARAGGTPRAQCAGVVDAALDDAGLRPLADRLPATLSGGERQRVALARALVARPRALLLDEPLAALDPAARRAVRASLATTLRTLALPALIVSHDAADARELGDVVVVLEGGRVTQAGPWAQLQAAPATPFVAELVRAP